MRSLSHLSSLRAIFCALVRLGFGGGVRTLGPLGSCQLQCKKTEDEHSDNDMWTLKASHKQFDNVKSKNNHVEAWYSLEQYIGLKEDKLSSTTVDFIRSEGNLETKHLYWFSKPKMC